MNTGLMLEAFYDEQFCLQTNAYNYLKLYFNFYVVAQKSRDRIKTKYVWKT